MYLCANTCPPPPSPWPCQAWALLEVLGIYLYRDTTLLVQVIGGRQLEGHSAAHALRTACCCLLYAPFQQPPKLAMLASMTNSARSSSGRPLQALCSAPSSCALAMRPCHVHSPASQVARCLHHEAVFYGGLREPDGPLARDPAAVAALDKVCGGRGVSAWGWVGEGHVKVHRGGHGL